MMYVKGNTVKILKKIWEVDRYRYVGIQITGIPPLYNKLSYVLDG